MAKALLGHVGGPDVRMLSEVRRLHQRVRELDRSQPRALDARIEQAHRLARRLDAAIAQALVIGHDRDAGCGAAPTAIVRAQIREDRGPAELSLLRALTACSRRYKSKRRPGSSPRYRP